MSQAFAARQGGEGSGPCAITPAAVPRRDLVVVIPAFQCERTIAAVVTGVRQHLERVLVVSDGSTDRTAERAREAGAEVVEFAENRGKGAALETGIAEALGDRPAALILMDADGQHDPADLPSFLVLWDAEAPDLIIGSRLADREVIPGARYWTNYIGSRVLSWMTGLELEDSQSGYRLLSATLAARIPLRARGYAVESEMLIKAARVRARVEHVRVRTIYNDAGSHFRPILDTLRISCAAVYFKVFEDSDPVS